MKSWGTALGLDNAKGFEDVVKEAAKAALIMMLLEPFVIPRNNWFQEHVDAMSVQARLDGNGPFLPPRARIHASSACLP